MKYSSSQLGQPEKPLSIVDSTWELIDPIPNIHQLFLEFNKAYFWGKLAGVEVKWSPRMTLCAGLCCYEGRGGLCSIRLSLPLLKLRPRHDLVQTLLHEMIHALLFVTDNNKDHDGHGPEFHKHMYRINKETGSKITVYHTFHDEVDAYRQHWWKCDGPCQKKHPYYGIVRRAMNRAPAPRDTWWSEHQRTCGGKYTKIKEPEGYGKKRKGEVQGKGKESKKTTGDKSQNEKSGLPKIGKSNSVNKDMKDITNFFSSSSTDSSGESSSARNSKRIKLDDTDSANCEGSHLGSSQKTVPFLGKGNLLGGNTKSRTLTNKDIVLVEPYLPSMTEKNMTSGNHSLDEIMRKRWLNFDDSQKGKLKKNNPVQSSGVDFNEPHRGSAERTKKNVGGSEQGKSKYPSIETQTGNKRMVDGSSALGKNLERKYNKIRQSPTKPNSSSSKKGLDSPSKGPTITDLFRKQNIGKGIGGTTNNKYLSTKQLPTNGQRTSYENLSDQDIEMDLEADSLFASELKSDQGLSYPGGIKIQTPIREVRVSHSSVRSIENNCVDKLRVNRIDTGIIGVSRNPSGSLGSSARTSSLGIDSPVPSSSKHARQSSVLIGEIPHSSPIIGSSSKPIAITDSPTNENPTWSSQDARVREELVSCPVCNTNVSSSTINAHLDMCLG